MYIYIYIHIYIYIYINNIIYIYIEHIRLFWSLDSYSELKTYISEAVLHRVE